MRDAETGKTMWVDTGSAAIRRQLERWATAKSRELDTLFSKTGVDMVKVYTGEDYVKPLMNMFRKREARS